MEPALADYEEETISINDDLAYLKIWRLTNGQIIKQILDNRHDRQILQAVIYPDGVATEVNYKDTVPNEEQDPSYHFTIKTILPEYGSHIGEYKTATHHDRWLYRYERSHELYDKDDKLIERVEQSEESHNLGLWAPAVSNYIFGKDVIFERAYGLTPPSYPQIVIVPSADIRLSAEEKFVPQPHRELVRTMEIQRAGFVTANFLQSSDVIISTDQNEGYWCNDGKLTPVKSYIRGFRPW